VVESLRRMREPVAVVLLVAVAVRLGTALTVLVLASGSPGASFSGPARSIFGWVLSPLAVVVLVSVVAACVLWDPTPHARALVGTSVVLVTADLVAAVGLWSVSMAAESGGRFISSAVFLSEMAIPAVAAVVLFRLLGARRDRRPASQPAPAPSISERPTVQQPADAPTWEPDRAVGAVWQTAGEAATGAAATAWGSPDEKGGWHPAAPPPGAHRDADRPEPAQARAAAQEESEEDLQPPRRTAPTRPADDPAEGDGGDTQQALGNGGRWY
jgi:hypothetical protein